MKAWDVEIDSDESYWILRVQAECDGGECDFRFELPADVAEQLHRAVKREIDPYIQEKEDARATWQSRSTVEHVQAELEAGVYAHDPHKRIWAEGVVAGEIPL